MRSACPSCRYRGEEGGGRGGRERGGRGKGGGGGGGGRGRGGGGAAMVSAVALTVVAAISGVGTAAPSASPVAASCWRNSANDGRREGSGSRARVSNSATAARHPARQQGRRGPQLRDASDSIAFGSPPEQRCTEERGRSTWMPSRRGRSRRRRSGAEDLRRHVLGRESNHIGGCDRLSGQQPGDAEVAQLDPAVVGRAARFLA